MNAIESQNEILDYALGMVVEISFLEESIRRKDLIISELTEQLKRAENDRDEWRALATEAGMG